MSNRKMKRIAVLTSGGDAPGMNAAIRGIVRAGIYHGLEVMGVDGGYSGLMNGEMTQLNLRSVSDIIGRGGTILHTSRCKEFSTPEGVAQAVRMAKVFKLDAIVVIGGDGSFRGARDLADAGLPVIGIPGTIDNDIGCTEYTIGYDTAMNTAMDAIDKLKDTAYSHERCSIVEVMGRNAGYIALNCAIAGGAEAVLLPEQTLDVDEDVIQPIIDSRNRGKKDYIVIVAEGVGNTMEIASHIKEVLGLKPTVTILGHLQRGGAPTLRDRVTASLMAVKAIESLCAGEYNRVVVQKGDEVKTMEIHEALDTQKTLDPHMILANKMLAL